MKTWVPVNNNKVVSWSFQAEDDYINNYITHVVDSSVETPEWYIDGITEFVNVTDLDVIPPIGATRSKNNKWIDPPIDPAVETQRRMVEARNSDDAFLREVRSLTTEGKTLTPEQRDRLMLVQAERSGYIEDN